MRDTLAERRSAMNERGLRRRELLIGLGAAVGTFPLGVPRALSATGEISFGYQATLWGAPAIVAEDLNLFQGLKAAVQMRRFSSGKAVRDAMIAGSVDMGSLGSTPFIVGVAKGEMAAIGAIAYAGRTLMVVADKKSGIKAVGDLKGKKVGSQRGSSTDHIFQNKILPAYGLTKNDVQFVNVSFQDQVSALASRSVDAFAGVDPYPSIAEHMGVGTVLIDYSKFDLTPVLIGINRPVLERNRAGVVEFLKGWLRSVRIFKENPAQAATVVWNNFKAQGYSVPQEVIRASIAHLEVTPEFIPELKPYLTEQARILVEQRQITQVPDWNRELVDGPLQEAMKA
jgi:sulfonate transport system substrate-binding protein